MKITTNYTLSAIIVAVSMLLAVPALAQVTNGSDDASFVAPVSGVQNPSSGTGTNSNGADDVTFTAPVSGVQNPGSGSGSVTNGQDDGTYTTPVPPTPPTPPVTPPSGGPTGGSTGSFTTGYSSGPVLVLAAPTVTPISTTSCPLITDYLKLGGDNNPIQVTKLQIFLKNSEKFDVDVNGIFDQKTDVAVKAFQLKYLPSVLGPWDATRATGFVYITTSKKINELACASPMVLSADDQAIIAEYKARGTTEQSSETISPENTNATGTLEVGNVTSTDNVAAVGGASVLARFWAFILNLFR